MFDLFKGSYLIIKKKAWEWQCDTKQKDRRPFILKNGKFCLVRYTNYAVNQGQRDSYIMKDTLNIISYINHQVIGVGHL